MLHIYRFPGVTEATVLRKVQNRLNFVEAIQTEFCFNVETTKSIPEDEMNKLLWLFTETFEPENVRRDVPFLAKNGKSGKVETIFEVGPRLAFTTAWSSNCSSMCQACGVSSVGRIERSRRFKLITSRELTEAEQTTFLSLIHDRMTECLYENPMQTFDHGILPEPVKIIPLMEQGRVALETLNNEQGLGFDDWDLSFYTDLFCTNLKRNPTDVECFDLAQSNSEHSRHWFFGGRLILNNEETPVSLFRLVKSTLPEKSNSIIAFHDNSSAIRGFEVNQLQPAVPGSPSPMVPRSLLLHPILTAETHNFPCGVAPFAGAETGTGGRLRDVQATGRGAFTIAGISAYCVGNLLIPHYPLPWEDATQAYPSNLATPLEIEIEASNGASDYGNKYGEPVIGGFTRSYGQRLQATGERYEWLKPIMFTAGLGLLDDRHAVKGSPEPGMIVCKIGGPAYRIGMGGGAASSRVSSTSTHDANLDFNAVQRGDAEMENRMNRVIRACVEMGEHNPIISIHDQGAGGNGNVLKEIVDPLGAVIEMRSIPVGDKSLSAREIWGAEYQENNAFLVRASELNKVLALSQRENCPVSPVGVVTNDGRIILHDAQANDSSSEEQKHPVDLPLSLVLGKMPQKVFISDTKQVTHVPLTLPAGLDVKAALDRVLRLLDVGSKRFLANKVDRCVSGLIAQQQCVGPLHTPLCSVAVVALSHGSTKGMASAVGEQPIKGLISPAAQARLTVAEAMSNLVFAAITDRSDIKGSGNWMWAAKLPGEANKMYECCKAMTETMIELGPGIDGGKDSLSMAAKANGEVVKGPGQVTLTLYAPCPDITLTVTPDFKQGYVDSIVLLIPLQSGNNHRLGGSALATVFNQLGDIVPDLDVAQLFIRTFDTIQTLIAKRLLLAGQDRSDGGLITALIEMAVAGHVGLDLHVPSIEGVNQIEFCFAEELGFILQVDKDHIEEVTSSFDRVHVPVVQLGHVVDAALGVTFHYGDEVLLQNEPVAELRALFEATSCVLEAMQSDPVTAKQEELGLRTRTGSQYKSTYPVLPTKASLITRLPASKPKVAVLRQEGSNGDREMLAAFHHAGIEAWDVNMSDLLTSAITLDRFRGIVFCGGFSYADVNDSAKGWAGVIRFNPSLLTQFDAFQQREDIFSLGVCNGCQLMALLGWIPFPKYTQETHSQAKEIVDNAALQPRFVHNASGRFESRFAAVKVLPSKAVLLQEMEGSTLGVWVAHGEGRLYLPNANHLQIIEDEGLAPLRYVDDNDMITMEYPLNPNGSPNGIAALTSPDGRHLAMMPHPERCFLSWQLPSAHPGVIKSAEHTAAPWLKLFQNARVFLEGDEEA